MTDYKDRVSGWATDIDWSKAPEGATHYFAPFFYKAEGPRVWLFDEKWELSSYSTLQIDERGFKHPAPQWNGEGLPPVGTVCELRTKTGGWGTAEIKYMSSTVCVWLWIRSDGGEQSVEWAEPPYRMEFRQIKTPAQIAAEEREKAIDEMYELTNTSSSPEVIRAQRNVCALLYDAGYRKGDDK